MSSNKILGCFTGLGLLILSGCAAITNPVANGIPARLLPDELLAESKEEIDQIPLSWLRLKQVDDDYKLDTGDILGVYIEGILPERNMNLPINFPESTSLPPSSGFPVHIRENGTVSLPLIPPIKVQDLTIEEAEKLIIKAYTEGLEESRQILKPGEARILVELARPRYTRVIVIREDNPNQRLAYNDPGFRTFNSAPLIQNRTQGAGDVLEIATIEADLLTALTRSGGPPGPNATNEVIIYRGFRSMSSDEPSLGTDSKVIRIPIRLRIGSDKPFSESDIRLRNDDIIYVPARKTDVYYTGGLLPAREVPLPPDYDLRVVEAVLRIGGSLINGGRFTNNFTGQTLTSGLGNPSPSLLTVIRRTPRGGQVTIRVDLNRATRDPRENILIREGDILLLQETPSEAVARYVSQTVRFTGLVNVFTRGSATANGAGQLP